MLIWLDVCLDLCSDQFWGLLGTLWSGWGSVGDFLLLRSQIYWGLCAYHVGSLHSVILRLVWVSVLVSVKVCLGFPCWLIWGFAVNPSAGKVRNLLEASLPGHIEGLPGVCAG